MLDLAGLNDSGGGVLLPSKCWRVRDTSWNNNRH